MVHLLQGAVELARVAFGKRHSGKIRVTPDELHIIKVGEKIPNATVISLFSMELTSFVRKVMQGGIGLDEVSLQVGQDENGGRGKVAVWTTPTLETNVDDLIKAVTPWVVPVSIDTRTNRTKVCFTFEDEETTLAVDYFVTGGRFPVEAAEDLLRKFNVNKHRFASTLRIILDKWPVEVYSGLEEKYIKYSL